MTWRSVGIVENDHMRVPHVLQQKQKFVPEQNAAIPPSERDLVPSGEHRLMPINELADGW